MKKYIDNIRDLILSGTAKDTVILFSGNLGAAFWGFLFTLIVARSLTVSDFGVFSAVLNLVVIISSLSDLGISTGVVNFVSMNHGSGDTKKVSEYIKAAFLIRTFAVVIMSIAAVVFSSFVSKTLLASTDTNMGIWVGALTIFWFFDLYFPYILQAQKSFGKSVIYDNSYYITRLLFALAFYVVGGLTIDKAFWAFGAGFLVTVIFTTIFVKWKFLFSKPDKETYKSLIKFSGWVSINRIVSSFSGRIDLQMLATMAGATATGLYSIPSRLATFIIVLSGSFSSVLATRLASFGDKEKEKSYIIKSTLAIVPIAVGIVIWILFAEPFIVLLFGNKYLESVPIFQALAASQIPFLFTVPAVSAIIYAMKKTVYIGVLSFFQLAAIVMLNYYLIPRFGVFGPTITFGITNTLLAIYVWTLVIKHYKV
jgi:O-antigen/teichoic acid export membrane protein